MRMLLSSGEKSLLFRQMQQANSQSNCQTTLKRGARAKVCAYAGKLTGSCVSNEGGKLLHIAVAVNIESSQFGLKVLSEVSM